MRKILMVPDAFIGPDSGAIAARCAARIWRSLGWDLSVYVTSDGAKSYDGFPLVARPVFRILENLVPGTDCESFERALVGLRPDCVFLLGTAVSKASIFSACHRHGIPVIAMWWTQDFYCVKKYAALEDGPCIQCISGPSWGPVRHGCSYGSTFGGLAETLLRNLVRNRFSNYIRGCDVLLGSSEDQLRRYREAGISTDRLLRCPLFFDETRFAGLSPTLGDYVVCYGQSRMEKGWHLLGSILDRCPDVRVVLPFQNQETAQSAIRDFDLARFPESRCKIVAGVTWNHGLAEIVAGARAVLIPSIWPTTTEYVLLEALGLGKPVIVFDVGIHGEVLIDRVNGFVAPLGGTDEFAHRINMVSSDARLAESVGEGAKRLFGELCNPDAYRAAFITAAERIGGCHGIEDAAFCE